MRVRAKVNVYGTYRATATVKARDGGQATGSGSVTVTGAPGNCPP